MKKLIIGNWKMYPQTVKEASAKFNVIKKTAGTLRNVQTVVCPPSIFAGDLRKLVTGHRCVLGAQNAWIDSEGAFTGEVSPAMIASLSFPYVIIGHSERRAMGETDELINKKIIAALKVGLTVVLCVGEHERDADGEYLKFISAQLRSDLKNIQRRDLEKVVVAYEPIWAIGKNALRAATPEDAHEVTISIKKTLADLSGAPAGDLAVLYGGSVDAKNAGEFLLKSGVVGLLVGRASLDTDVFMEILKKADSIK